MSPSSCEPMHSSPHLPQLLLLSPPSACRCRLPQTCAALSTVLLPGLCHSCRELSKYQLLVVVDVPLPAALFGYKDAPTQLCQLPQVLFAHMCSNSQAPTVQARLRMGANQQASPPAQHIASCRSGCGWLGGWRAISRLQIKQAFQHPPPSPPQIRTTVPCAPQTCCARCIAALFIGYCSWGRLRGKPSCHPDQPSLTACIIPHCMHHPSLHASSLTACIIPRCMHHPSLHASSLTACIIPRCMHHPSLHASLTAYIIPRCMHHPSLHASSLTACIIPRCMHHPSLHASSLAAYIIPHCMHHDHAFVRMYCHHGLPRHFPRSLESLPATAALKHLRAGGGVGV